MDLEWKYWSQLALRWVHIFASILWVGQTYFFTWLDGRFHAAEKAASEGTAPSQVWMVHSGGFYVVQKQKVPELSQPLYWWRWEAMITWLSGFLLLGLVYHMGGLMVDEDVADISNGKAVMIGLAVLVVGWAVYDLLWISPLARNEAVLTAISVALLIATGYGLTQVLSGRAAYIHVGALMGTIMTANVWMRILPAQRRMIAAVKEGRAPDPAQAERAKFRSKHNTFMAVAVVVIMISSHYPTLTYGTRHAWAVLAGLILVGFAAAKVIRSH